MKRSAHLETRTPLERGEPLRPRRWGTRPKAKRASWRDAYFIDDDAMARGATKKTPYEKALAAYVRQLPCCVCGRPATKERPNQASHVTLSADQKGHGAKVPHVQVVSHCSRLGAGGCHEQWDQRRGFCAGWSKERRYEQAAKWLADLEQLITPDDRDHADELERAFLGKVIGNGRDGWQWWPGHLTEVDAGALAGAVGA